jgi:hypothetical protein
MEIYHAKININLIENEALSKKQLLCMKSIEIVKRVLEPSWMGPTQETQGT